MSVQTITHDGETVAQIFDFSGVEKTQFFSDPSESMQVGVIVYGQDSEIIPHVHNRVERQLTDTSEVLLVLEGSCIVDFYTRDQAYISSAQLSQGQVIKLFDAGGHGFRTQTGFKFMEIKQGPYMGDQDKTRFEYTGGPRDV